MKNIGYLFLTIMVMVTVNPTHVQAQAAPGAVPVPQQVMPPPPEALEYYGLRPPPPPPPPGSSPGGGDICRNLTFEQRSEIARCRQMTTDGGGQGGRSPARAHPPTQGR